MSGLVEVSGVASDVLDGAGIAAWVHNMASREREPEDFDTWGEDLLGAHGPSGPCPLPGSRRGRNWWPPPSSWPICKGESPRRLG